MNPDLQLASYNYRLPQSLIAQTPASPRDSSRLLIVNSRQDCSHDTFNNLTSWLREGDLLVLNNTRVIRARLYGRKTTGSQVEILLLEERSPDCWLALVKPGRRFSLGSEILFKKLDKRQQKQDSQLRATVIARDEATGGRILQFQLPPNESLHEYLAAYGELPLPPYIEGDNDLQASYQTVYAKRSGAIAAPTAGLHFTPELLAELGEKGIEQASITLHVGIGTFRPVEISKIENHVMHQEWIEVSQNAVNKILATKARGGRVIAVGTTVARALEGTMKETNADRLEHFRGKTDLFIYPGYQWQVVDGLITNFHLPESSLLMLVSALIGRQRLLALYHEAIALEYRFYSFGDAMLILPKARI